MDERFSYVLTAIILLGVVLLAAFGAVYLGLSRLRKKVKTSWSALNAVLKKRYRVLPELVQALKSRGISDKSVESLEEVLKKARKARNPRENAELDTEINSILADLFSRDDISGQEEISSLHEKIRSLEEEISALLEDYNSSAAEYNAKRSGGTGQIAAGMFDFNEAEAYQPEKMDSRNK